MAEAKLVRLEIGGQDVTPYISRGWWDESQHPRQAGKFTSKGQSGSRDSVGYDAKGKSGAGYGKAGGDSRVLQLQKYLNGLGFRDGNGERLKLDGKLGPKTTASIKSLQKRMGMKADGVVTPEMLSKLRKAFSTVKAGSRESRTKAVASLGPQKKAAKKVAKKAAPDLTPKKVKPGTEMAAGRARVAKRSVGYSRDMTDIDRHGTHNQRSHGNRLGKSTNVAGKTGLGSAADKARVGTSSVRLDDQVEIVRGERNMMGGHNPLFGRKGRVRSIEHDQVHVQLEGDREGDYKVIRKDNLKVTRTAQDMDSEDRKTLDRESADIRARAAKRRAGT